MITRFSVINDKRKVILGLDKANVFEPGMVYEAFEMLDEIIIRKLGPYALLKDSKEEYRQACEHSDISSQLHSGLPFITEKEYQTLL